MNEQASIRKRNFFISFFSKLFMPTTKQGFENDPFIVEKPEFLGKKFTKLHEDFPKSRISKLDEMGQKLAMEVDTETGKLQLIFSRLKCTNARFISKKPIVMNSNQPQK